ncbi:glycosyltransferase (plasmid) [Sulfitobacter faviae]|uniref:glycosyltransferase n=1 Tax=Sulfitobacter faviae TaxID=1775881 RepID=UPI002306F335|nr:glycosyltransferase [Sulfitobacter faviae]WCE68579.1 glycosyltransferase [Sulfitobacter faviae]
MIREKWAYRHHTSAIRSLIGTENYTTRRIPVPPVGVHPTARQLQFFTTAQLGALARQIARTRADVVRCRSYVATHLALLVRQKFALSFKIVFDARSMMPEEGVLTGRWGAYSSDFAFWKAREAQMAAQADLTLSVSEPMRQNFAKIGARHSALSYLNVPLKTPDDSAVSDISRLDAGTPVMAYAGYLADGSWHVPANLWQVFASFQSHIPRAKLLVITKSSHSALTRSLAQSQFSHLQSCVSLTSANSPTEVVQLLAGADLSVLSYRTPENEFETEMSLATFATKTAEYLSVGLPVAVNRYCGGAASYAVGHDAGVAYDPYEGLTAAQANTLMRQARERPRISAAAQKDFNVDENTDRFVQLLKDL